MIRVHVLVEGQTEETFVKSVLQAHFNRREIIPLSQTAWQART